MRYFNKFLSCSFCVFLGFGIVVANKTIDTSIPECDPVVQAPVIIINDIPKTCHLSKNLWGNIPEDLGGDDSAVGNNAIYGGKVYSNSSEKEYGSGLCRRGKFVFGEVQDQKSYRFLFRKYLRNNLLSVYGIGGLGYNLLTIWPSTYYESRDTYETVSDKKRYTLYALGYQEGYQNIQDYEIDRPIFTFQGKLYSPFYSGVNEYNSNEIDQNAQMQIIGVTTNTYSSPWKITGYKNKKLTFTRQTNIAIKRDNSGNAIRLGSGDDAYKSKYGKHDYGYIVSYNIETCTEN